MTNTPMEKKSVCITQEEYKELMALVTTAINRIDILTSKVNEGQEDSKQTREFITGNGDPAHGILYRLKAIEALLTSHIANHKEKEEKLWGVISPTISKMFERVVEVIIIVLALVGPTYLVLQNFLKQVSEIVVTGG